jgi:hypothetical protein
MSDSMTPATEPLSPGGNVTREEFRAGLEENSRYLKALFGEADRELKEAARVMREDAEEHRQRQKELDRQSKETDRKFKETDRKFEETARQFEEIARRFKETDRKFKETDRQLGRLGNRLGELAEHLVAPNIKEKFNALGYRFDYNYANAEVRAEGRVVAEVDILLENSEYALAVEVKSKPVVTDVLDHVRRMEMLCRYPRRFRDGQVRLLGAIAGAVLTDTARNYIIKHGFFAIEQSGDTVKINVPEGFKPREW